MLIALSEAARPNQLAPYTHSPSKGDHMADLSEEELAGLITKIGANSDRHAFAEVFRHFAPRIKGFALKQSSDRTAAEELVQETMLAVWRSAKTYDYTKSSAATWVFTICRNKRIDLFRRRSRPEPELSEELEVAPTQYRAVETSADFRRTREFMKNLPEEQAEVLALSFLEEKPHREIAAQLGLPLGTVKSRIRLALTSLRQSMEQ